MNRRQRRANGQRRQWTPQQMARATACPDCNSDVVLIEAAPRVYQAEVHHDDSCPWYRAFKRSGGLGVRFGHTQDPEGDRR